jgi:hypothetical protein
MPENATAAIMRTIMEEEPIITELVYQYFKATR